MISTVFVDHSIQEQEGINQECLLGLLWLSDINPASSGCCHFLIASALGSESLSNFPFDALQVWRVLGITGAELAEIFLAKIFCNLRETSQRWPSREAEEIREFLHSGNSTELGVF